MSKPKVLVALGCFWPGNDASGPNQSFIALATALQDEFEFRVVARDREPGAAESRAPGGWVDLGYAQARYLEIGRFGARGLASLLRETPHDLLWLNSVYDREFTLPALISGASRAAKVISPRGELSSTPRVNSLPSSLASMSRSIVTVTRLGPGSASTASVVSAFLPR